MAENLLFQHASKYVPEGNSKTELLKGAKRDHLSVFVVTSGEGVRQRSEEAKNAGYYFRSHGLQSLAIETAEASVEWLRRRIREDWGSPDPPEMTMAQRFTSRYQGKPYGFGYPACPDLEDQAGLGKLLEPEEIGVQLTEGFMRSNKQADATITG